MGKTARERQQDWEQRAELQRICDEAQADGVPCAEPDGDCENCEHAEERPKDPRDRVPNDERPPVSGA